MNDPQEVLKTSKVIRALKRAARITAVTGKETHISIWQVKNRVRCKIVIGLTDRVGGSMAGGSADILEEFDWRQFPEEESDKYISLHFHPDPDTAILPSENDLERFFDDATDEDFTCVLSGVGHVNTKGNITFLLLKTPPSYRDLVDDYEESLERLSITPPLVQQEEIRQILERYGIKTALWSVGRIRVVPLP